jgi:hypothetical protein
MGLDSVELLLEIETYFDIEIPDSEAVEIYTVGNFTACVVRHVTLFPEPVDIKAIVWQQVLPCLIFEGDVEIAWQTPLAEVFPKPDRLALWNQLVQCTSLKFPNLEENLREQVKQQKSTFFGLRFYQVWTDDPIIPGHTVGDLLDWLVSLNHEQFIDPKRLRSAYEVERALIAILCDKTGVGVSHVKLQHRIVADLGID